MSKQVKKKVNNENNRKRWFEYLFEKHGIKNEEIAAGLGIKRDSLYKKMAGINSFSEKDIDYILKVLNDKSQDQNNKIKNNKIKITYNYNYEYVFKMEGYNEY